MVAWILNYFLLIIRNISLLLGSITYGDKHYPSVYGYTVFS